MYKKENEAKTAAKIAETRKETQFEIIKNMIRNGLDRATIKLCPGISDIELDALI